MPATYSSIFDGDTIITKADLCRILNLDLKRPNLEFSNSEINRAFRQRAQKIHPDKQIENDSLKLPVDVALIAMQECENAKYYLINKEYNIPGKAFGKKNVPTDWVELIISGLNSIKNNASTVSNAVYWANALSGVGKFALIGLLSTFSQGHLNFRFINSFANLMHSIQPYAKDIDGSAIAGFLTFLKAQLNASEQLDIQSITDQLKAALPAEMVKNAKIDPLIDAIKEAGQSLKATLTDEFIKNVKSLIGYWGDFVANVPSWGTITTVYFGALLFTANSLPKYFNALLDISKVILEYKGGWALTLASIPMYVVAVAMLPVNIGIDLAIFLMKMALLTAFALFVNAYALIPSLIALPFSKDTQELKKYGLIIFEALVNAAIRLPAVLLVRTLQQVIFMITDITLLQSVLVSLNESMNSIFGMITSGVVAKEDDDAGMQVQLIQVDDGLLELEQTGDQEEAPISVESVGFFKKPKLVFNENDTWLEALVSTVRGKSKPQLNCDSQEEGAFNCPAS